MKIEDRAKAKLAAKEEFAGWLELFGPSPSVENNLDPERRMRHLMEAEAATKGGMEPVDEKMHYLARSLGVNVPHPRTIDPLFEWGGKGSRSASEFMEIYFSIFELRSFYMMYCNMVHARREPTPTERQDIIASIRAYPIMGLTAEEVRTRWLTVDGSAFNSNESKTEAERIVLTLEGRIPENHEAWIGFFNRAWGATGIKPEMFPMRRWTSAFLALFPVEKVRRAFEGRRISLCFSREFAVASTWNHKELTNVDQPVVNQYIKMATRVYKWLVTPSRNSWFVLCAPLHEGPHRSD
jgi:hypothetical protein